MVPEISVVIPLYDKERYIRRTIDSVLRQTFLNFELIIIDSSTDRSSEIVQLYSDPRINHIIRDRTRAAPARNLGVRIAKSDYVAFLDADDEWLPDHLETLVSLRKKYPDAGLYSTPYIKLKPDGRPWVMLFAGIAPPPWEGYLTDYLQICSSGDEPVNSSSCAIPRQVFSDIGGFPEDLEYGEDQFLWGRIAISYPVAFSWRGLSIYHTDAEGRICDESHEIIEHPFSEYLKSELVKDTIPPDKRASCYAYIRRKRMTVLFGSFVVSKKSHKKAGDCESNEPRQDNRTTQGFAKIICRSFKKIHDSDLHDTLRLLICRFFHYHNPGIEYHVKIDQESANDLTEYKN